MAKYYFLKSLMIYLLLVGCAQSGNYDSRNISEFSYKSYHEKVFLAGQPTNEQLASFHKKEKVDVVINLRNDNEVSGLKFDPKTGAESLKLTYYHLPLLVNGKLDKTSIANIESTFMFHHKQGEKVLVYCSSGNRAAAWLATHFVSQHGLSIEKAINEGKASGLSGSLVFKVRQYLNES